MSFNFELWGGLAGIAGKAYFQHKASTTKHKADLASQKFANEQALLDASHQQGIITMNSIFAEEAQITESLAIQKQESILLANAEVSAAAAGVAGASVENQKVRIRRSAAQQQVARRLRGVQETVAAVEQKFQVRMDAIAGKDRTVHTKPNAANALLGVAQQGLEHVRKTDPNLLNSFLTFGS